MTEQIKAEAYIRKQQPVLIEVNIKKKKSGKIGAVKTKLPLNLQDWLAVLSKLGVSVTAYVLENGLTEVEIDYEARIYFNLTDGQPNSPADYKAFNEITSI